MSAPFAADFSETFKTYVSDPTKQLNLGYTVVSFWYIAAFFLGLFLVTVAFVIVGIRKEYRAGNKSKKGLMTLVWVGFALMLFGLWTTINSFYTVVAKINANVRQNKGCSLFIPESAQSAADVIASSSLLERNVEDLVSKRRSALIGSRGISDEYGMPDSRSSLVFSGDVSKAAAGLPAVRVSASENPFAQQQGAISQNEILRQQVAAQLGVNYPGLPNNANSSNLENQFRTLSGEQIVQAAENIIERLPLEKDKAVYAKKLYNELVARDQGQPGHGSPVQLPPRAAEIVNKYYKPQ